MAEISGNMWRMVLAMFVRLISARTRSLAALAIAGSLALACTAGPASSAGLTPADVAQRVTDVIESQPDGPAATDGLAAAIESEFTQERPQFEGDDGTPFPPITKSGVMGHPQVRRLSEDKGVRVALVYADADARPGGDMYCLVVEVPQQDQPRWASAEADFSDPKLCRNPQPEDEWRALSL